MIQIQSNCGQVLRHIRAFKQAVPRALEGAIIGLGIERFRATANAVLTALATPGQERLVTAFVGAVDWDLVKRGAIWTLKVPLGAPGLASVSAAQAAILRTHGYMRREPADDDRADPFSGTRLRPLRATPDEAANLNLVRTAIEEWATREKRLGPDETPAEAAERIAWILGVSDDTRPGSRSSAVDDAAAALTPHIQKWMIDHPSGDAAGSRGSDDATIQGWLEAVLYAWRVMVLEELPALVRAALHKAWVQTENAPGLINAE